MQYLLHILLVAFISLGLANADTTTFKTSEKCSTIKGNIKQTPVTTVTNYMTTTSTRYPTTTVTPTSTVTRASRPVTKKSTSTVTVFTSTKKGKHTKTTTVTSIETDFATVLNTETQVGTSTVTLTSTVSTTIPTPAGFTPLASAIGFSPRGLRERGFSPRGLRERRAKKYAQSVECNQVVKEVIIADTLTETADTTTITVASTTTVVVTSTERAVKTVAAATITATTSATTLMTVTSTTTSFSTPTITVPDTTATTYDACAANNVISTANGGQPIYGIFTLDLNVIGSRIGGASTDATSCCNACQATANCAFYAFSNDLSYNNRTTCLITLASSTCDGSSSPQAKSGFKTGTNPKYTYVIGNGQCGQVENLGIEN